MFTIFNSSPLSNLPQVWWLKQSKEVQLCRLVTRGKEFYQAIHKKTTVLGVRIPLEPKTIYLLLILYIKTFNFHIHGAVTLNQKNTCHSLCSSDNPNNILWRFEEDFQKIARIAPFPIQCAWFKFKRSGPGLNFHWRVITVFKLWNNCMEGNILLRLADWTAIETTVVQHFTNI